MMKSLLDSRVSSMKAQSMTFSNNGAEFSLSIPDSDDVKRVFGELISTIVEQQKSIETLQSNIGVMIVEHAKAQEVMIAWTTKNLQALKKQNYLLKSQIQSADQKLKNFSYNMQGYEDKELDDIQVIQSVFVKDVDLSTSIEPLVIPPSSILEYAPSKDDSIQFFPTEDPSVSTSIATVETPQRAKKVRAKEKSSLYETTPSNAFPKDPRKRWLWAFRALARKNRIKHNLICLSKSRVIKGQSVLERLERIETDLFQIPVDMKTYVSNKFTIQGIMLKESFEKIEGTIAEEKDCRVELSVETDKKFGTVDEKIALVDSSVQEMRENMKAHSDQSSAIIDQHLKKINTRIGDSEIDRLASWNSRVKLLRLRSQQTRSQIQISSDELPHLSPESVGTMELVDILKLDTKARSAREELKSLSGEVACLTEILSMCKCEITSATCGLSDEDSASLHAELGAIEGFLADCVEMLSKVNKGLSVHDVAVAEDWKLVMAEQRGGCMRSGEAVVDAAALAKDVAHLAGSVTDLHERLSAVESAKQTKFDDRRHEDRVKRDDDNSVESVGDLFPTGVHLEASAAQIDWTEQLKPLVKNIVSAYLKMEVGYHDDGEDSIDSYDVDSVGGSYMTGKVAGGGGGATQTIRMSSVSRSRDQFIRQYDADTNGGDGDAEGEEECRHFADDRDDDEDDEFIDRQERRDRRAYSRQELADDEVGDGQDAASVKRSERVRRGESDHGQHMVTDAEQEMEDTYDRPDVQRHRQTYSDQMGSEGDLNFSSTENETQFHATDAGTEFTSSKVHDLVPQRRSLSREYEHEPRNGRVMLGSNQSVPHRRQKEGAGETRRDPGVRGDSGDTFLHKMDSETNSEPGDEQTAYVENVSDTGAVDSTQGGVTRRADREYREQEGHGGARLVRVKSPGPVAMAVRQEHLNGEEALPVQMERSYDKSREKFNMSFSVGGPGPDGDTSLSPRTGTPLANRRDKQKPYKISVKIKNEMYVERESSGDNINRYNSSAPTRTDIARSAETNRDTEIRYKSSAPTRRDNPRRGEPHRDDFDRQNSSVDNARLGEPDGENLKRNNDISGPRPSHGPARKVSGAQHAAKELTSSSAQGKMLSDEIIDIARKIERLYKEKLDMDAGMAILASKANTSDLNDKVDVEVVEGVKRSLEEISAQLGGLRQLHKEEVLQVQQKMEQQLTGAIQQLIQDKAAEDKYTTLNSKSMCIGCGRSSLVRSIPSTRVQSPNFVSTLTGPPLPGSDILRAGFKMSVRGIQSPLSPNSLAGLDLMTDDNLANDGSSFGDSVAPIVPMFGEPAGPYATNRLQPAFGTLRVASTVRAIRHAQGRDEAAMLRPIHRKGFPGKKSMKAEATYAPERFDVPREAGVMSGLNVMSRSMPIARAARPRTSAD